MPKYEDSSARKPRNILVCSLQNEPIDKIISKLLKQGILGEKATTRLIRLGDTTVDEIKQYCLET